MIHELIFATNNQHKLHEIQHLIGDNFKIRSLKELGCTDDIAETADTLEGNALLKAQYIFENYHMNCFADDTGLEVAALDGRPGVYSARYASDGHDFEANIVKLLGELSEIADRKARFRTVIALIEGGNVTYFEGIVDGQIISERKGGQGFGYDPVFLPDGYELTFAEMPLAEKNKISHRARAVGKLVDYLKRQA